MNLKRYNLRVYGLLTHKDKVLITYEQLAGMIMRKFPGGGLEISEGLTDCLKREFQEELNIEVEIGELFYVNEFMQVSQFNEEERLISFYYCVSTEQLDEIPTQNYEGELKRGQQIFEWVKIKDIDPENLTFPVDQVVGHKLIEAAN